jgi:hypothetical protein
VRSSLYHSSLQLSVLLSVSLGFFLFKKKKKKNQKDVHFGNPRSVNFNHFASEGPQSEEVSQRRVLLGTTAIVATAFVVFQLTKLSRGESPGTLSKEWKAAAEQRHRARQMAPISSHKPGAKVTIYEPSIVEGKD